MAKEDIEEKDAKGQEEQAEKEEEKVTDQAEAQEESKEEEEEMSAEEKLQIELSEAKDKYLRLYSEFENFRRRNAKERIELVKNASEELITALLPVVDDFERAEKSFNEEVSSDSAKEGFGLIKNKFIKILEQKGLTAMESDPGIEFDSEIHEAITKIPAPDEKLKGKVVDVVEKGYLLNDKVIRFAKVVIGE